MTLLDAFPGMSQHDVRILASDIDRAVLAAARAGIYSDRELDAVPTRMQERFFIREAGTWRVRDDLRRLVSFRQLNLIDQWPMTRRFDVIFCRNVMIYFSEATQEGLWPRFAALLDTGGTLFLGHSERMHNPSRIGLRANGVTTYVKAPRET